MNIIIPEKKAHIPLLALWGGVYLALAFVSLKLDDPQSRVAMVWFPAGAAVSACLSLPRRFWPALYLVLFTLRTGLDVLMRHSLETSLIISLISLSGDFIVALAVQHFSREQDDFRKICVWLISTLVISALAATAGAGWLASRHPLSFAPTALLWWAANASGNIVATTVLTGLTWEHARLKPMEVVKTFTGVMIVAITALFIFSLPPGEEASAGLIYGLACLPVLLTIVVPLVAGAQAGALAFLALSIVVIYFSWQQAGPFFIDGLQRGEPLLLAQGYLSGTAVLTIFFRVLLRLPEARGELHSAGDNREETAFRLDHQSGKMDWDPLGSFVPGRYLSELTDRDSLLRTVEPDVRAMLTSRWTLAAKGGPQQEPIVFSLKFDDGEEIQVQERGLSFLSDTAGEYIVGYWSPAGPSAFVHEERG